ncbi:Imm49 family immunity protein [Halorussus ruber]|uniref:Imm49 family immunity protein n=1 Tax=Halorussus ruber TaxID=1126238 RepID=UPI00143CD262|nr:Imm49 family immunity protein [Halorussus ruber]
MQITEEELRSNREFKKELIAEAKTDLKENKVPHDRVHLVYNSLGGDYRDLGVYSSLLAEESKACKQFAEAADYYLSGVRTARERQDEISKGNRGSEPSYLLKALYTAPLACDDELLDEVARTTLEMDATYVTEFPDMDFKYYAAKALASVILDTGEAQANLQSLNNSLDDLRPEMRQFFGAIATFIEGIFASDENMVAEGIQQLLDHHSSTFKGEPTTTKEAVSLPATALLLLARKKETGVSIESEYILPIAEGDD